ncbi:MAG: hypothetical protein IJC14_01630 [Firmicutes bacterium]|nr:hypothetical protein [Bacillota bacterium]
MSKREFLIIAILLIAILVVGIMVITDNRRGEVIIEDFEAPSFDEGAVLGVPENVDGAYRYSELAVAEGFIVSMCIDPVEVEGEAQVYFTSAAENIVWTKLQLFDENGKLLGESGVLRPGEYVESVTLLNVPKESSLIIAKLLSYEPDTYYSKGTATAQIMLHIN